MCFWENAEPDATLRSARRGRDWPATSLALNEGLFEAADRLAMLLVERRGYAESRANVEDSQSARRSSSRDGLAWTHRAKGDKTAGREELASALRVRRALEIRGQTGPHKTKVCPHHELVARSDLNLRIGTLAPEKK
jgi:hypothetical protein